YGETASDLLDLWVRQDNPTYSHGPLLLLVCGILAYKKSKAARLDIKDKPDMLGLSLVLGLSLIWLAAALAQVQIVQYLCLIFLLLALFYTLFGAGSLRVYGLPVLLLLFSIPFWEIFNGLLQWLTIVWVRFLLNASGIPAVSSGIILEVPAGMFRVEDSCSGLSQFIVAGAVALIFADSLRLNLRKSMFVVLAALAVAVISNIIRVYIVVVAGQMTQMRHSLVTDHYALGWVLFGGLFFVFLYLLTGYFRNHIPHEPPPVHRHRSHSPAKTSYLVIAVPCLAALTGPVLLSLLDARAGNEDYAPVALPQAIGNWKKSDGSFETWQTRFSGYDYRNDGYYSNGAGDVQLTVYQYVKQRQGKEAVSDMNHVYGEYAEPLARATVNLNAGYIRSVSEGLFKRGSGRHLVWHWYQSAGLGTANPAFAKLLGVWGRIGNDPSVMVFIVESDATHSVNDARERLEDFTRALSALSR
ncbi:MAG TPA: EpsI family protein, partial [Gammaproteobacteria bacterium]